MPGFWKKNRPQGETGAGANAQQAGRDNAFPGLDEASLVALYNAAEPVTFSSGDQPFTLEQLASDLVIVVSGALELHVDGQPVTKVEVYETGACIGRLGLDSLEGNQGPWSVRARNAGSALMVNAEAFERLDQPVQLYLLQRMRFDLRKRFLEQRNRAEILENSRSRLLEQMYRLRTERGAGFGQSPLAKKLFSKVPSLPLSSMNLLNKMLDDRTTHREIVDLVSQDYSLTSTLLKAVNSPAYGLRTRITNINQAMLLLGHEQVYQIVMSESMRKTLPDTPAFAKIHEYSVDVSRIAFAMAKIQSRVKPSEIATIGLLGQIGLVMVELLKKSNPMLGPLFDFVDAAEMGAELLRTWKLPETLCETLRYQDYPEFASPGHVPGEVRSGVTLLYLARRMHQALREVAPSDSGVFVDDYLQAIGLEHMTENELFGRVLQLLGKEIESLPRSLGNLLNESRRK
ncbi:MAG: HDOD domain-containing protein [Wenzhouxiangella sp.]